MCDGTVVSEDLVMNHDELVVTYRCGLSLIVGNLRGRHPSAHDLVALHDEKLFKDILMREEM